MLKKHVVVYGPLFSASGYGHHTRDIIRSLQVMGDVELHAIETRWGGSSSETFLEPAERTSLEYLTKHNDPGKNAYTFIQIGLPHEFRPVGSFNIGVTAGIEAVGYPKAWVDACNAMDLIIVPSAFVKGEFVNAGVLKPIYVVGEGVDTSIYKPTDIHRYKLDLPGKFYFFFNGQFLPYSMGADRKQLGLLLDVFGATFQGNPEVGLLVKSYSDNLSTPDRELTKTRIKGIIKRYPGIDVRLLHGQLTPPEMSALYNHPKVKALVSPSSGEGFGRANIEAIAVGLPLITTNCTAMLDYVDPNYDAIISHKLGPVPSVLHADGLFTQGMAWSYPDVESLAQKMLGVYENYEVWRAKAKAGSTRIENVLDSDTTDKLFREIIKNNLVTAIDKEEITIGTEKY